MPDKLELEFNDTWARDKELISKANEPGRTKHQHWYVLLHLMEHLKQKPPINLKATGSLPDAMKWVALKCCHVH